MSTLQQGTILKHGGYSSRSRFNIIQHHYAGSEGGYIELLEILNPPFGSAKFFIYQYVPGYPEIVAYPSSFTEFRSLECAKEAWPIFFSMNYNHWIKELKMRFKSKSRFVLCEAKTPWFYALPGETIEGDFVQATPQLQLCF